MTKIITIFTLAVLTIGLLAPVGVSAQFLTPKDDLFTNLSKYQLILTKEKKATKKNFQLQEPEGIIGKEAYNSHSALIKSINILVCENKYAGGNNSNSFSQYPLLGPLGNVDGETPTVLTTLTSSECQTICWERKCGPFAKPTTPKAKSLTGTTTAAKKTATGYGIFGNKQRESIVKPGKANSMSSLTKQVRTVKIRGDVTIYDLSNAIDNYQVDSKGHKEGLVAIYKKLLNVPLKNPDENSIITYRNQLGIINEKICSISPSILSVKQLKIGLYNRNYMYQMDFEKKCEKGTATTQPQLITNPGL